MAEWTKFKIGTISARGSSQDCQRLVTVSHTTHIDSALSILDQGEIRPYLVFDKSMLNDKRILVSWLSPNDWGTGYRYGNIKFDFDFKTLIAGKRFYWVESIAYKIPACRILVTDLDHGGELLEYDPTSKEGPWWHDLTSDQHYFNGYHCLEFMFESSISVKSIKSIEFVKHHSEYCAINRNTPKRCKELGYGGSRGGAIFIARAIASGYKLKTLKTHFVQASGRPNSKLEYAVEELCARVARNVDFHGDLKAESVEGVAVAKAICSAFSFHQSDNAKQLASLFNTEEEFDSAIAIAVGEAFALSDWRHLLPGDE